MDQNKRDEIVLKKYQKQSELLEKIGDFIWNGKIENAEKLLLTSSTNNKNGKSPWRFTPITAQLSTIRVLIVDQENNSNSNAIVGLNNAESSLQKIIDNISEELSDDEENDEDLDQQSDGISTPKQKKNNQHQNNASSSSFFGSFFGASKPIRKLTPVQELNNKWKVLLAKALLSEVELFSTGVYFRSTSFLKGGMFVFCLCCFLFVCFDFS